MIIDEWRELIGNSELISLIAELIVPLKGELTVQLLRCIGNLSYDNGTKFTYLIGFNRDMIAETDGAVQR